MKKYKVGDRVVGNNPYNKGFGIEGTIIDYHFDESFCVEFDEFIGGHDGGGKGKIGYCWWLSKHDAKKLVQTSKIVITTDGKETLARLFEDGKVVRSATAKCSPEDEFDFSFGARLAFDRLMGTASEKKKEYYNGKVVCIKSGYNWWTVGKVYEVVDGVIISDDGDAYPGSSYEPYTDAEDVRHAGRYNGKHNYKNEFIPITE